MRARNVLLACCVIVATCAAAVAGEPRGPAFGKTKYAGEIAESAGEPDTDDFVAGLIDGETLSVTVTAGKRSALLPLLTLIDPDGVERAVEVKIKKKGKSAQLKGFLIDVPGRWAVRVSGDAGSTGTYSAAFKLKKPKTQKVKDLGLGNGQPLLIERPFGGSEGALLTLTLKWSKDSSPVRLVQIMSPSGALVPGNDGRTVEETATVKGRKLTLKKLPLTPGDGTYTATFAVDSGSADFDLVFKVKPPARPKGKIALLPFEPALDPNTVPQRGVSGLETVLSGSGFTTDVIPEAFFDGFPATDVSVSDDGTQLFVTPPLIAVGRVVSVAIVNADGQAEVVDDYFVYADVPDLRELVAADGSPITRGSSLGGQTVRLLGSGFHANDTVEFGGVAATLQSVVGTTELVVVTTPHDPGVVDVVVFDEFGRSSTLPGAYKFPRLGFGDETALRWPGTTDTDDLSAIRGAVGDLDLDGKVDDVVLISPLYTYSYQYPESGTRETHVRLLVGGTDDTLADRTLGDVPSAFSGGSAFVTDDWNATALAIGDVDGGNGPDIVFAGSSYTYYDGFGDKHLLGSSKEAAGVRIFLNDNRGDFRFDAGIVPAAYPDRADVIARDENLVEHVLFAGYSDDSAHARALAIGDVDGDGDADVVLTRDGFSTRRIRQDVDAVDFTMSPPSISSVDAAAYTQSSYRNQAYLSGTHLLVNDLDGGGSFVYDTATRFPLSAGGYETGYTGTTAPGLHGEDMVLGDIDGDDDLDIVVTWHDPTTASVRGLVRYLESHEIDPERPLSYESAIVATRVLLNDGAGRFTDATDAWLPEGAGEEFWQAHRVALVNLDGDDDLDLVLSHRDGLEAFLANVPADVNTTAAQGTSTPGSIGVADEVDVFEFTVAQTGRFVIDVDPGTLVDPELEVSGPDSAGIPVDRNDDRRGPDLGSRISAELLPGKYFVSVAAHVPAATGTYTLRVVRRAIDVSGPSRAQHALRVLENRGEEDGFVDVTETVLPPVDRPNGEDYRGGALLVDDVNNDGIPDILVGSAEELRDSGGRVRHSTRLLLGSAAFRFTLSNDFLPPVTTDTGQAQDLLLGDIAGNPERALILLTEIPPETSTNSEPSRVFDWSR